MARHFLSGGNLTPGSWEFDVLSLLGKGKNDKALALIIENTDTRLVRLLMGKVFDHYVEDRRIAEVVSNLRGITDQEMPESILQDAFQVIEDMSRGVIENKRIEEEQRLRGIVKDIARDKA